MLDCYRLCMNGAEINYISNGKLITEQTNITGTCVYGDRCICLPLCSWFSKWCCCNCQWIRNNYIEIQNNNDFELSNITISLYIHNSDMVFGSLTNVSKFCNYKITDNIFDINIPTLMPGEKFYVEFETVKFRNNYRQLGEITVNVSTQVAMSDSSFMNYSQTCNF